MIIKHWLVPFLLIILVFIGPFIAGILFSTNTDFRLTKYYYPNGNFIYRNNGDSEIKIKKRKILFNFAGDKNGLSGIGLSLNFFKQTAANAFLFKLKNNELNINYQDTYLTDIYQASQYLNFEFNPIINSEGKLFQAEIEILECPRPPCKIAGEIRPNLQVKYSYATGNYFKEAIKFLTTRFSREIKLLNLFFAVSVFLLLVNSLSLLLKELFKINIPYKYYLIGLGGSFAFLIFTMTNQNINSLLFNLLLASMVSTFLFDLHKYLYLSALVIFMSGLLFFLQWNESVGNNLSFWSYLFFLSFAGIEFGKKGKKLWI